MNGMNYSRPPSGYAAPQALRPQTQPPPPFRVSVQPGQYFPSPQMPQQPHYSMPMPVPQPQQPQSQQSLGPPRQQSVPPRPSSAAGVGGILNENSRLSITPPTINDLADLYQRAVSSGDPTTRVRFAKLLFRFIERTQAAKQDDSASNSSTSSIRDQRIVKWVEEAVGWIKRYRSAMPPIPEALYLHGDLAKAGTFPSLVPQNHGVAFRDFEEAAKADYAPAWYRIGREYEAFKEYRRARDAYEDGRRIGDVTCTYRLGKALLHGELEMEANARKAVDYHHTAALISERLGEPETAGPMYIYAMMLAGEFDAPNLTPDILAQNPTEACEWLKKAAYLNHALSQFKCGHAYENAYLGLPFDPVSSVEYYYLASLQGNDEAYMGLSKWFLCGAKDPNAQKDDVFLFPPDEELAYHFAKLAARKKEPLPAAVFALAFYHERGIAGNKDPEKARQGYEQVASMDDPHLQALAKQHLESLLAGNESQSRAQQQDLETTLVRKHTQARLRSDETRRQQPNNASFQADSQQQSFRRRNTIKKIQQEALGNQSPNSGSTSTLLDPRRSASASPRPVRAPSPAPPMSMPPQQQVPQFSQPIRQGSVPPPGTQFYAGPPGPPHGAAPAVALPPQFAGQQPPRPMSGPVRQPTVTAPAHLPRYTLTDSPLPPPSVAASSDSGYSSSTPSKRPQATSKNSSVEVSLETKAQKGPETFAQMGIPVEKLSKNDQCTIM